MAKIDFQPIDFQPIEGQNTPPKAPEPENLGTNLADLGRGVAQGATLGFADELTGGAEAAKDVLSGEKASKFLELYRKHQKESEANYAQAKERSPWLYGGGELAGTLAPGILTAGAAAPEAGVLTAKGLAQLGAKGIAKEVGKSALKGAAGGALLGGIASAGSSENTLDNAQSAQGLASDALGGAEVGAALGGALGGAGTLAKAGIGKLGQFAEERPFYRQMGKAYDQGTSGETIGDTRAYAEKTARGQAVDRGEVADLFTGGENQLGQNIEDTLKTAKPVAIAKDTTESLLGRQVVGAGGTPIKVPGLIDVAQQNNLLQPDTIADLKAAAKGPVPPTLLWNARKAVYSAMQSTEDVNDRNQLFRLYSQLGEDLGSNVQGLKPLMGQFNQFRRAGTETILAGGQDPSVANIWAGNLPNKNLSLHKGVEDLLGGLTAPGTSKIEANQTLSYLMDNLSKFEAENPGKLEELGLPNPQALRSNLEGKADQVAISRQALGYNPKSNPFSSAASAVTGGTATTGRGKAIETANKVGKLVGIGSDIFNAGEDKLRSLADALSAKGLGSLGSSLSKSLDNKNLVMRNATLFSILQNPQSRGLVYDEAGKPEVKEGE